MPQKPKNFTRWSLSGRKIFIVSFGIILSIIGILGSIFWIEIFASIMAKKMALQPNTIVYENWKNPSLELYLDIYVFNWTNPHDFKNLSTKPILAECGPYRFIEKPDKIDIRWHLENDSVTYRRKSFYYFDAANSVGQLDDEIITLNAVALSAASKAKHWDPVRRKMVDVGLKLYNQEISVIRTTEELLFSGYNDNMLDMARVMPIFGEDVEVPFDKFGWFYPRNGSADLTGLFNVYTGINDIHRLGKMHTWNYNTHTGFYDSYCGLVNGSAGEFQPPNLTTESTIELFTADMCRSIPLNYVNMVDVEGIQGYKYAGGQKSIDNGSLYPENRCFCGDKCVPSGVMNISSCRFGSPVFMSYPHFYLADEFYINQVHGLQPNAEQHEFFMILEPKTGISLEVAARFQVNMLVEPIPGISLYQNTPYIYFPLLWFEQKVHIPSNMAKDIRLILYIVQSGYVIIAVLFVIGITLICWYPMKLVWSRYQLRPQQQQQQQQQQDQQRQQQQLCENDMNEVETWRKQATVKNKTQIQDSSPLLDKVNRTIRDVTILPIKNNGNESKSL